MLGIHLLLDCFECEYSTLTDCSFIAQVLMQCVRTLSMTQIKPPEVFQYTGEGVGEWGISGIVFIAESHLSIHTLPDKHSLSFDLFSCKPFDVALAIETVVPLFKAQKYHHQLLTRGQESPHHGEENGCDCSL